MISIDNVSFGYGEAQETLSQVSAAIAPGECVLPVSYTHLDVYKRQVMDALKGKRAEVVDVSNLSASMLRIGDLEIHHEQRRVLMAGREVELNHGEYAMLYCMASSPGQVFSKAQLYEAAWGGGISKRDKLRGEYHLAAETETGT